jgi:hypothetical protein
MYVLIVYTFKHICVLVKIKGALSDLKFKHSRELNKMSKYFQLIIWK